jgi:glycosyltransferase 2 family protein
VGREGSGDEMSRTAWAWLRLLGGVLVLAVVIWRLGTGPFVDGVRSVDRWSLVAAAGMALLTTVCCAWRWSLVARGLGVDVPLRTAVAAYYQSQFLNTILPGGVLGDVQRGLRHGRDVGDVGRGLRAVGWERTAGQVVQMVLTLVVLFAMPSPVRSATPLFAVALVTVSLIVVAASRALPRVGPSRLARTVRAAAADLRDGLTARGAWPGIVVASAVVVLGHATLFLIAARTAGATASPARILPLALLVLLAMAVPANVGGWGPREGVAAWVFGAAGLSADQGVATAVVYGVMGLVGSLPGAGVLAATWLRRHPVRLPRLLGSVRGTSPDGVHDSDSASVLT